jgi:tetratricopeptide (TPR) repeat protein
MALSREWGVRARLEQAIEHFEEALQHDPEYEAAYTGLVFVESDMYRNFDTTEERILRAEEARQAFETMIEQDPNFGARNIGMTQYYLAAGNYEEALATIERDAARDTLMVRYYRAATLAAMGRTEAALEALKDLFDKGFRDFVNLDASSYFDGLRDDPRFQELINRYRS